MASTTKMTSLKGLALPSTRSRPMPVATRARARTVCEAKTLDKLTTALVTGTPAFLAASPAMAKLNVGMNTEGTGAILGITDPAVGWVILLVFGVVWAVYAASAKGLGGGEGDDSGLSL